MPVVHGLQNCIAESLNKSLAANKKGVASARDVSSVVMSSAKRALLEKATLTFVKAEKDANSMLQNLKDKYICLTQNSKGESSDVQKNDKSATEGRDNKKPKSDGLPLPKVVLYSPDQVQLAWPTPRRVGGGLTNLGNTCFLNSVLQCLGYTAPLASHLISGHHKAKCRCNGFCMLCELETLLSKCLSLHGGALKPLNVLQKLKLIAKHLRWGRQEDAHEFLRYVVDAMQKSCLTGQNTSLEKLSKETTFVHQVFGGYLRSQVKCMQCKTSSRTYDPVLDVSLDIKGVNTVERGLQKFVQAEILDLDNAYRCLRCQKKVRALKQFTIHRAPKVLTLHLKRFDYHRLMGGKVSRHIDFLPTLNLRPYMSNKEGGPVNYQLYAVLVHSGFSCNSGHYYCYIKAPNQTWYCMNDSHVSPTGLNSVLSSEAYILFYSQLAPAKVTKASAAQGVTTQQKKQPVSSSQKFHSATNIHANPGSNSAGTPAAKSVSQQSSSISTPAPGPAKIATPAPAKILTPAPGPAKIPTPSPSPAKKIPTSAPAKVPTPSQESGKPLSSSHGPVKTATPSQQTKILSPSRSLKVSGLPQGSSNASTPSHSQGSAKVPTLSAAASPKQTEAVSNNLAGPRRVPLTKLMSPPRNPVVNTPGKLAGTNWQVVNTNGHLPSHSDSEAGSVNSTSSWTVSTTPKYDKPHVTSMKGDSKKMKRSRKELNEQISVSLSGNRSAVEDSSNSMSPEKENHVSHRLESDSCRPAKKIKRDSKSCLQISNETTPEPLTTSKKKKRKRKKKKRLVEDQNRSLSALANGDQNTARPHINGGSFIPTKKPTSHSISASGQHDSKATAQGVVPSLTPPDKSVVESDIPQTMSSNKTLVTHKKRPADIVILNGHGSEVMKDTSSSAQISSSVGNGANRTAQGSIQSSVTHHSAPLHAEGKLKENGSALPRAKGKKRRFSEPVTKVWNAAVDGDDAAFKRESNSLSAWDGRKESNISFLMERHASKINGLGTGVSTWDGGKPEVNRELEREKLTSSYRNSWYDGYEQEIDEGRRKKVKVKKRGSMNGRDHFQSIQNTTNKVRQLKREGKLSSLSNHDY